jgi:hypothetical protein
MREAQESGLIVLSRAASTAVTIVAVRYVTHYRLANR